MERSSPIKICRSFWSSTCLGKIKWLINQFYISLMVMLQLRQLQVPPGQRLLIQQVNWREFENILVDLGEHRAARLAYHQETLDIRMPSPEHEVDKELIGDLVKLLLDELEIDCECFGSTTFKRQEMQSGIEPDQCFYIQNHLLMRGKRRIDLNVDPSPDLAIEVDVTSKTQRDADLALGVPELWCYENGRLRIYLLQTEQYQASPISPLFPNLPILDLISDAVQQSLTLGRSAALRGFRHALKAVLSL